MAGVVIAVLLSVSVIVYICVQFEKVKKAKRAVANRVRGRYPLAPGSQVNDSQLETEAAADDLVSLEPTFSQLLIADPESSVPELGPSASEQQPSFVEPSAPAFSMTPPPSFEEASKYPTLSLELDPPPPYPGFPLTELQQYPINNPAYQPSNYY